MVIELVKNQDRYIIKYQMIDAKTKETIANGIDEGDLVNFHVFYDGIDYDVVHVEQVVGNETIQESSRTAAKKTLHGLMKETVKISPFALTAFPFMNIRGKDEPHTGFCTYKNGKSYYYFYTEKAEIPNGDAKPYKTVVDVFGKADDYYVIFGMRKRDTENIFYCAYDMFGGLVAIIEETSNETKRPENSKLYLTDQRYLELGLLMLGHYVMADQCFDFDSGFVKGSKTGKLDANEEKHIPKAYSQMLDEDFILAAKDDTE